MEEGEIRVNLIVKSSNSVNNDLVEGNKINVEGELLVMNDPSNKFIIELTTTNDNGVDVEWKLVDPNEDNALTSEAFQDGSIKLGKKGNSLAKYWYQYQNYDFIENESTNTSAITNIINRKSEIIFEPSAVGGDNFIIIAKIKNENGRIIKTVESNILTVVRRIKFENLFNMQNVRNLSQFASEANIQNYFNDAFIIYEAPDQSIVLADQFSVEYLAQYDRNNPQTFQYAWTEIASPIDYDPPKIKTNGNIVYTEKLTQEEQTNCESQSVLDKADSWKIRLLNLKTECRRNWLDDIGLSNAIISIKNYHIMYGNENDPDVNYNPFLPCTNVTINVSGFTSVIGSGILWSSPVGGINLPNGITVVGKQVSGDENIMNVIAHEVGHTTNDIVNENPIMYRIEFGQGDHSPNYGIGLMESYFYIYGEIINFSPRELKILRGYK